MSAEDPQQDLITFSCDSCGARYSVTSEMRGREAACKQCSSLIVIPGGRRYPGEKRDPLLDQVPKVRQPLPVAGKKGAPKSFMGRSHHIEVESTSALKTIACVLAVILILSTSLVLTLGASPEGMLAGVVTNNRILVAGFIAILSTVLLIYGNSRSWLLMLLIGLVAGTAMTGLPLLFTGGSSLSVDNVGGKTSDDTSGSDAGLTGPSEDELREMIGINPLEKERQRLLETPSEKTALGLWLRGMEERHRMLIEEYVIREMGASEDSHFYPRGRGDFLMVVTGISPDLNDLADAAEALGEVKATHASLHTIEVAVDNNHFKSGPIDKLTDQQSPDFYPLNAIELKSIDLGRVSAAVRRLSEAKPELLRDDIEDRLIELLRSDWFEQKGDVCRALLVWAGKDSEAGKEALSQAVLLEQANQPVPEEVIALCVQQGESDVLPILYRLWQGDPTRWEPWFGVVGPESEKVMLRGFDKITGVLHKSACRILGQVGGELSLPALRVVAATTTDSETQIIATNSIQQIEKRLAKGQ